jgi:DNA (cytosine-5)-methyltransferase 1
MGLHRAGFHVIGVDIRPQSRYPFEFHQADALSYPLEGFDFIWTSPPCQGYTAMRFAPGARGARKLIGSIRSRLLETRALWVIENVEAARWAMRDPVMLCGSMFGLGAQGCQLRRHRLFEANFPIIAPPCAHKHPTIGVYGGHARRRAASAGGRGTRDEWEGGHAAAAGAAMGIDWMRLAELSEAIPPAYALHVARSAIAFAMGRATHRSRRRATPKPLLGSRSSL